MKVAQVIAPGRGALFDKPDLQPKGDLAVVKIHAAPMCTEYHAFRAGQRMGIAGHEAAGQIVATDGPGRYPVGSRVLVQPQYACGRCERCHAGWHIHCEHQRDIVGETGQDAGRDAFAQYMLKPDWLLTPIPEPMSYDHAVMACCGLGPTFGAMQAIGVGALDTVVILGLGPVGLGGVINARYRNSRVIGIDGNAYRADLARQLGAEAVIDPAAPDPAAQVMRLTEGRGVSVCIETSGIAAAKQLALTILARRGRLGLVGWQGDLTASTIIAKGLTVAGAWHYNLADAPKLLKVIADCASAIDLLITHRFALTDIQEAWEVQVAGKCGKVILHPWPSQES